MSAFKTMICSITLVLFVINNAGCKQQSSGTGNGKAAASSSDRCPHAIKAEKCPFCTPSLVESDGFCGEHGVAEALCYQCRPYLKEAFRKKGDWCATHNAPKSQCTECDPELLKNRRPGGHGVAELTGSVNASSATACPHEIEAAKCPFCTPSLIQTMGFCSGHNIAEALCVKCQPYLKTAFKAKGDWCEEHDTPESQCAACNPALAKPEAPSI